MTSIIEPTGNMMDFKNKEQVNRWVAILTQLPRYISVILLVMFIIILVLGPFYWIASTSLKPTEEIISNTQTLLPKRWVIDHYQRLLVGTKYLVYLRNSLFVSFGSVFLTLIVSCLAAYGLHRPTFFGKSIISRLVLVTYMFPGILLLIPLYQMFSKFHLTDNLFGLMIINVAFASPLSTWLLASFFRFIPHEVEESAMVDGASRTRVLTNIILPLLKPGLTAVAIYAFIMSWQEYTFSSVFITQESLKTLPLGLNTLMTQYHVDWGLMAAGATAITIPVIFLFAIMGRRFVEGLISGAVKG